MWITIYNKLSLKVAISRNSKILENVHRILAGTELFLKILIERIIDTNKYICFFSRWKRRILVHMSRSGIAYNVQTLLRTYFCVKKRWLQKLTTKTKTFFPIIPSIFWHCLGLNIIKNRSYKIDMRKRPMKKD